MREICWLSSQCSWRSKGRWDKHCWNHQEEIITPQFYIIYYKKMKGLWERETTFWQDFTIADKFGKKAVKDTYDRAFWEWKTNLVYITELVIVLNRKSWQHSDNWNIDMSETYVKLREKTHNWCLSHLKKDDLKYYLNKVD